MLLNAAGIRILSRLVAKSRQEEILELLFCIGIFEILAKTLQEAMQEFCSIL